jgi:HKD family nuclease
LSTSLEAPFPVTTLFPESAATVVGVPFAFNLSSALHEAASIRLATAFAHVSGWNLLEGGVRASKGDVFLLTGLDYLQTEPKVLHKWLQLTTDKRYRSSLLTRTKSTFHPKVLIVRREASQGGFAIVGSGNLSEGGLRTNIECSLLVDDPCYLAALTIWFDDLFKLAQPLTRRAIEEYEPRYQKARKALAKVRSEQKTTEKILLQQRTTFENRQEAIEKARAYLRLQEYKSSHETRLKAVDEIKGVLH